ncbi:hypothetical protein D9M72_537500 [compost metagenome]
MARISAFACSTSDCSTVASPAAKPLLKPAKRCAKSISMVKASLGVVSTAWSKAFSVAAGFCGTQGENDSTLICLFVRSNSYRRIRPLPPW